MRVAIIGAGPRGLFAVERLWAHLPGQAGAEVVLFDPQPPGVGAAYDPGQPGHLRLNVTSSIVSAAWPGENTVPALDAWRRARGEAEPLDPFPPRALVGEYLSWFWRWLQEHAPGGATVRHRAQRVFSLRAGLAGGWLVDGEPFDEVLLATGHELTWPGKLSGDAVVPAVFPIDVWLSEERIPAGSAVAVRGAALTFIDAALALTEGRGGRFDGDGRLVYHPSGREPRVIWPIARAGRWMDPKPQPGTAPADAPAAVLEEGRQAVLDAATAEESLGAVAEVAARLGADSAQIAELLEPLHGDPTALLRARLAAMLGDGDPGAAWALGHAWRGLYDALRSRFEGTGEGFAPFADLAGRLERVAFGPPPVNAAKILALIDAGIIDPASLQQSSIAGAVPEGLPGAADVVVDAVLAPPGVVEGSLVADLVEAGVLHSPPGRRGVAVGDDASCLDAEGRAVRALACIGRATEDVVIGNDTLNRALHPAVDGWARRIASISEKGSTS